MAMRTARTLVALAMIGVLAGCASGRETASQRGEESLTATTATSAPAGGEERVYDWANATVEAFAVPAGTRPHDVAVAADGGVWYTGQGSGKVGRLDPTTGEVDEVDLGRGSGPHGVIIGPDGAVWVTASGLSALVRIDQATKDVSRHDLPAEHRDVNVHTAVFDRAGTQWFTGNGGVYGRLRADGELEVFDAPGGGGPYGITATPNGDVYYASLGQSHLARVDPASGTATVLEPPTPRQGTRRAWTDSSGRVWCSQWNTGQLAVYDPAANSWREWKLPGDRPQAYAVYVADDDSVWLSDFGANTMVWFDPATEAFQSFPLPDDPGDVRQIHGRPGEVWGAESAADKLVVVRAG
jgi:virginiamycin B lyase